ncbi:MAG: tetracycline resistance MFS efflux pump [Patescibacteria group bacterium]|nr:MAG: tetracycline resistance MFS efflux pump [Patescibacteria group bacterium]
MFGLIGRKQNNNSGLAILGLIMLTNALTYGIIIPLLYPYSSKFGVTPVTLSFLFATYSLFQFISTPILGRLSDRFGRKPLLLICILGTSVAMALFASASSIVMLFVARMVDGITGGNISVAQAMVADKVKGKDRAKAFGMLGAAFGFGFLVGPAIGGLLSQISLSAPFWFASALALFASILGYFKLEESVHTIAVFKQKHEPLFNFSALLKALFDPTVGAILLVSLIAATVSNSFIIGFNAYSVDILSLTAKQIGMIYTMAGFMSVVMQIAGIKFLLQKFQSKEAIVKIAFLGSFFSLLALGMGLSFYQFVFVLFIYMIFHAVITPLISAILSERTNEEDQGLVLGINQSYISLGQIIGPLSAGLMSRISVSFIFIAAAILMYGGFLFMQFGKSTMKKVNA